MVKIGVHLWKLLQNLNRIITFLDHRVHNIFFSDL